jgi:hypothetical protein
MGTGTFLPEAGGRAKLTFKPSKTIFTDRPVYSAHKNYVLNNIFNFYYNKKTIVMSVVLHECVS